MTDKELMAGIIEVVYASEHDIPTSGRATKIMQLIAERDKHRDAVVLNDLAWCVGRLRGLGYPVERLEKKYGFGQSNQQQKGES